MKYTLLTAAALATVAIAAPAPEKALSLRDLSLSGDDNKATVNGNTLTLVLNLQPIVEALLGNANSVEVPTNSKAKAKRGHDQGAQLVNTVKDLVSKIQGHANDVDNTLLRIRTGGLSRGQGRAQCLDLLGSISSLLHDALGSLNGLSITDPGDYDQDELLGLLGGLTNTVSSTVNNVVRALGLGGGQVGSGTLAPLFQGLSDLLECVLGTDPSLGTGIQGILNSLLGGVGTGTGAGTGTGVGLLGGLLNGALTPVENLLRGLKLNVGINLGGKGSIGGDDSDDSSDDDDDDDENSGGNGSSGSGSGSSGSGNGSPVYNVPT
ncbi:hypothetical protein MRS44_003606 [Fusarium solani]|uniref:Cell wall protein n=1 Tax=Fusarium solani TaxID=169388 RepID=A0A9P9L368_FUSSL|nr:uncharacterized protein B0J15DRAFT_573947 [Fusarium solani]KAH7273110.1 hypothetical protein B0J15DRAFT_573947 [Fusarium solani]KAJ3469541.1 hypothetical protein MRS44_003606 [Fusarium solani]